MKDTDLKAVKNLMRNEWNWNLLDFCEHLGIQPDTYAEEKFKAFRTVSVGLRQFSDEWLKILCGD